MYVFCEFIQINRIKFKLAFLTPDMESSKSKKIYFSKAFKRNFAYF